MTKIRIIFKWADRCKHWTSKQTRSGVLSFWSDFFSAYRWCALLGGHEGGGCKHSSVQGQHPPAGGNRGWNCSGTSLQLARVCQPCLQAVAWHQALGTFSLLRRSSRYGVLQNDHRWCRGGEAAGYPAASEQTGTNAKCTASSSIVSWAAPVPVQQHSGIHLRRCCLSQTPVKFGCFEAWFSRFVEDGKCE